jgi:hypothetical protein
VVLALVFASVIDATVRYFWVDEILTSTLVGDPSLPHMLRALADQVDTSPPLYYVIAWGWARLFGPEAMSLRVLSGLFAGAGFVILWRTLRPYASLATRAAVVTAAVLLPNVFLFQMAEARSYGLLVALCALALYQLDLLSRTDAPTGKTLLAVAASQAALSVTHTFGLVYSGATLAALIVDDLLRHRRRLRVYGAWMGGWVAFVAWLPALRRQMDVGVPRFPIPPATPRLLADGLWLGIRPAAAVIVGVLLATAVMLAFRSRPDAIAPRPGARPLLLGAGAWIGAAVAIWLVSRLWRPLFLPRYVVPLALAYAVLGAVGIQWLLDRGVAFARRRALLPEHSPPARSWLWPLVAVAAIAIVEPVNRANRLPTSLRPGGDSLESIQDLPIATISTHTFLPRVHYAAHPERYAFILDWESALRPDSPVGPTEYKLMAAMARHYPRVWVEQGERFLATTPRFLVIDEGGLFWFKRRVAPDPALSVRLVYPELACGSGLPGVHCKVYLVERRTGAMASHSER